MSDNPSTGLPVNLEANSTIDYALRTAQQNTLQLSSMADQKASIVLGSSFVITSIVFTGLDATDLEAARLSLAVTSVVSGLLAALALLPRMSWRRSVGSKPNLLFFGTVSRLDHADYRRRMREMLADDADIYDAIIEDLYQAASAPARKYQLLWLSYVTLMVGMVVSLVLAITA